MSNKSQQKCPNSNFEAQNQGKVCFGLLITLNGLLWGTDWQRVEEKEYMNNCMICLICLIVTQVHSQYHRHFSPFFGYRTITGQVNHKNSCQEICRY